jgi:hypothetical protein
MKSVVCALLFVAVVAVASEGDPPDRYGSNRCKGLSTADCISDTVEDYGKYDVIANRVLSEMFVVNPPLFLKILGQHEDVYQLWLQDLELYTFREWAGSLEAELRHAANMRLRELMLQATIEQAANPNTRRQANALREALEQIPQQVKQHPD